MADKVAAGQPIPRSAGLWNNIIDCANEYAQRQLGEPGSVQFTPNPTDLIKIKNSSGSHIRLGEVLEISGFLLTNVLRTSLWFDGDVPDATRPFAIALQDIPTTSIDRAQVSGVCVAWVNISDTNHGYAEVATGEVVLVSAASGPLRILYKPTGTGEKLCAVLFSSTSSGGRNSVAITDTVIPARSGTTPGGPISVTRQKLDDLDTPEFVDDGTVDVYSWVKSDSSDPANEDGGELYIFIEQDAYGVWWFTGEDCPPG